MNANIFENAINPIINGKIEDAIEFFRTTRLHICLILTIFFETQRILYLLTNPGL